MITFLGQSPEEVRIHPDNMIILMDHLKCASFELPFSTIRIIWRI